MIKPFILCGVLSTLFTSSLSAEDEQTWFIDPNSIYEQGNALSLEYLQKKSPRFLRVLKKALPWIVRIEAQHSFKKKGFTSNHGTGIILKGGKVITAFHIFTNNIPANNEKIKVQLTLTDGRVFSARIMQHGHRDWAMLQINNPQDLTQSPIVLSTPKKDETTIFLGYPAQLGIDNHGKIQSFYKQDKINKIATSRLNPTTVVASISDPKIMTLKPIAGFPAVGGMSGGPILNIKGEVVGVQVGITKTAEKASGKILSYRIDATSSNDFAHLKP